MEYRHLWFVFILTGITQRVQTSLAEADHYSHIAHCKNVEPWLWKTTHPPKKKKKKKRFWIITCTTIWVCYHYYGVFFAHLLILQYPDHHQNLISSSLYYSGPVHKISSQSVHNFLSNVVHRQTIKQTDRQTDRQTNQRYQKHNLLCQGGNNDFEANITSLMSNVQWANVKFFPEPTGELYGWLLTTLVYFLGKGGYVFGSVGLFVCLFVCLWTALLKKLWTDWDEILWRDPG